MSWQSARQVAFIYLGEVLLTEHVFMRLYVFGVFRQPDSPALTTTFWLQDVRLVLLLPRVCQEIAMTTVKQQWQVNNRYSSVTPNNSSFNCFSTQVHGRNHNHEISTTHKTGEFIHKRSVKTKSIEKGKSFSIRFMLRANRSFRHSSLIPGK